MRLYERPPWPPGRLEELIKELESRPDQPLLGQPRPPRAQPSNGQPFIKPLQPEGEPHPYRPPDAPSSSPSPKRPSGPRPSGPANPPFRPAMPRPAASPSSTSSANTKIILASTISGCVLVIVAAILLVWWFRRRSNNQGQQRNAVVAATSQMQMLDLKGVKFVSNPLDEGKGAGGGTGSTATDSAFGHSTHITNSTVDDTYLHSDPSVDSFIMYMDALEGSIPPTPGAASSKYFTGVASSRYLTGAASSRYMTGDGGSVATQHTSPAAPPQHPAPSDQLSVPPLTAASLLYPSDVALPLSADSAPAVDSAVGARRSSVEGGPAACGAPDRWGCVITERTPQMAGCRLDIDFVSEVVLQTGPGAVLGAGCFGTVHKGVYDGMQVAVKTINSAWTGASKVSELESFKQEVAVLSRCDHPHIVRLFGASLVPPHVCLVEELMACSLDDVIHDSTNPLPLEKVLRLARDIASGLSYLHPTVLHRDLKPANVLLDDSGNAKLVDFGLARLRTSTLVTNHPEAGTCAYMAPECFDDRFNGTLKKCDIFSLGVLLWEMLTRTRPWEGLRHVVIAFTVVQGNRLVLPQDPAVCPVKLRKVIERCWHADPDKRPEAAALVKLFSILLEELREQ